MKLILIALLSVLSCHCCNGYPSDEGEISEDPLLENVTSIEYRLDASSNTASNDSSPRDNNGFGEKILDKVKEGIKTVEDKVKDVYDKVKDTLKDGFEKVKEQIKDLEDKIGSKGGKNDRDNNREKHNRDKYKQGNSYSDGSGFSDPTAKWISLGIGIFMIAVILGIIICLVCTIDRD